MSETSGIHGDEQNFPPATVDGFAFGAQLASDFSSGIEAIASRQLSTDERAMILGELLPGASYFYELTVAAGELAGSGDPLGALSLLGGEEESRAMLGDEETDKLLAEATEQMAQENEANSD